LIDAARRNASKALKEQEMENAEDLGNTLGIVKEMLKDPGRQVRELRKKVLVRSQANLLTLAN
jgi:hypothetical protein